MGMWMRGGEGCTGYTRHRQRQNERDEQDADEPTTWPLVARDERRRCGTPPESREGERLVAAGSNDSLPAPTAEARIHTGKVARAVVWVEGGHGEVRQGRQEQQDSRQDPEDPAARRRRHGCEESGCEERRRSDAQQSLSSDA
jgi:hypothetical protein